VKRFCALAALLAVVVLCTGFNRTKPANFANESTAITSGNGAPFVDSTGIFWSYFPRLEFWASPLPAIFFHSGAFSGGAFGLWSASAVLCDTTSTAAVGITARDSTIAVGIKWQSKQTGTVPNDSIQIYLNTASGPTLKYVVAMNGSNGSVYGVDLFAGPEEYWTAWLIAKASGPTHPSTMTVELIRYKFRRKA
jgi:hypothetical protein